MAVQLKSSQAGSTEKGDILIALEPSDAQGGIEIDLHCSAEAEFGRQIRRTITQVLCEYGIQNVKVTATDKGAMDFAIRARTETAAKRARG